MVSYLILEGKMNGDTNFRVMHLYMFFKLYHKGVCRGCTLEKNTKEPCPRSDLVFCALRGTIIPSLEAGHR
jgi:hypothetical protein